MAFMKGARALSGSERAILERILTGSFRGGARLLRQLDDVKVAGTWGVESPSVDLKVAGDAPPVDAPDGVLPVVGEVFDESGDLVGELLVWVSEGYLSALEYSWFTDEPPVALPDVARVSVRWDG
ncbi:hypothetical protein [Streptomyces sp. NPDC049585]|uniref:hypothetical protein n=1 Tax=Streptomyces sp. NPDC049585 TaxID=3155154 RepID=UPI003420A490